MPLLEYAWHGFENPYVLGSRYNQDDALSKGEREIPRALDRGMKASQNFVGVKYFLFWEVHRD